MLKSKLLSFILILSIASSVCAISGDIYKSLGLSEGGVVPILGTEESCAGGPFKLVGETGREVLMVGSAITFRRPTKSKENEVQADDKTCAEDVHSVLMGKKLVMTTTIYSCPEKMKLLESVTEESIEVNKVTIKYSRKSRGSTLQCIFNWMKNE